MRNKVIGSILAVAVVASIGTTVGVAAALDRGSAPLIVGRTATDGPTLSLPGGHWTALPTAPIVGRSNAVGVWTGDQMLVWGGANPSGSRAYADGATYNPATRRWTGLPTAPLSARSSAASVWTGRLLFVWGGSDARGHADSDGALYHPSTRRWTKLAAPPIPAHSSAQALWTGRQILLLTAPLGRSFDHLTLQAYDPSSHQWTVLPTLHLRPHHDGMYATGVLAGNRLLLWSNWAHARRTHDGGGEITSGIDGYSFDLDDWSWTPTSFTSPSNDSVDQALWTGQQVLIPASQIWCGDCPGPYSSHTTGLRVDPQTGAARTIAHGPADDLGGAYLWTGSVLLAMNTTASETGGLGASSYPGVAAYWQPSTNTWTRLPSAPLAGGDAVTVWTGHSVLIWGELSPVHQVDPARLRTAGLQFSR